MARKRYSDEHGFSNHRIFGIRTIFVDASRE